jgi:hypothetical protein
MGGRRLFTRSRASRARPPHQEGITVAMSWRRGITYRYIEIKANKELIPAIIPYLQNPRVFLCSSLVRLASATTETKRRGLTLQISQQQHRPPQLQPSTHPAPQPLLCLHNLPTPHLPLLDSSHSIDHLPSCTDPIPVLFLSQVRRIPPSISSFPAPSTLPLP